MFVALPLVIGIVQGEHPGEEPAQTIIFIEGSVDLTCNQATGVWERSGSPVPEVGCQIGTNTCCPSDKPHCVSGVCQAEPVALPSLCGEFTTKASCEALDANPDIDLIYDIIVDELQGRNIDFSPNDVLTSDFCNDDTSVFTYETGNSCRVLAGPCGCVWRPTDPTDTEGVGPGECGANWQDYVYTETDFDCNDITDTDPDDDGTPDITNGNENSDRFECRTSPGVYDDQCATSGIILYRYTAQIYEIAGGNAILAPGQSSPSCQSGERTLSCPESLSTSVPFFTAINFIITLFVVLFIYSLMRFDRKK